MISVSYSPIHRWVIHHARRYVSHAFLPLVSKRIHSSVSERNEPTEYHGIHRHASIRFQVCSTASRRHTRHWCCFLRSSLKSDTKWLSWLAYQFHMAVDRSRGTTAEDPNPEDSMDLETFKNSFHFKVVRIAAAAAGTNPSVRY